MQAAVNQAASGDTVVIPAGNCTWNGTLSIPNNKKITLQGAGMEATKITRSSSSVAIDLNQSGSRVTGIGFTNGYIVVDGDDWRIDHCRFSASAAFSDGVRVEGNRPTAHPRGLVDNNRFVNTRVLVIGDINLAAHALWAQPLNLGSAQMVFIEDNEFVGTTGNGHAADMNYGGRFVFRYNTVTDLYLEVHSLQQGRASRSWEIYNNTFTATRSLWTPLFVRGGTGVIFNNVIKASGGSWGQPTITIDNVRSYESGWPDGRCNGNSPVDGNQQSNGWPCRDQIGRGGDTSLWTSQNPYPSQSSSPAYFWNNTSGSSAMSVYVHNGTGAWIQSGRDFFNNTQRPGYTPYTYPHPLRSGGSTPTPTPTPASPTNVRIIR